MLEDMAKAGIAPNAVVYDNLEVRVAPPSDVHRHPCPLVPPLAVDHSRVQ
jgi:hypothetical protein